MGTHVPFDENQMKLFSTRIKQLKSLPGPLMPILHDAQKIFGHIPISIQKIISNELSISVAKINGIVTFYGNFSVEPKGTHQISVCLGTACYVKGSSNIMETLENHFHVKAGETTKDGHVSLCATRCIGACGLAPVFSVDGKVIGTATVAKTNQEIALLEDVMHHEFTNNHQ